MADELNSPTRARRLKAALGSLLFLVVAPGVAAAAFLAIVFSFVRLFEEPVLEADYGD